MARHEGSKELLGVLGMALLALAAAVCLTWVAADDVAKTEVEESIRGVVGGSDDEQREPTSWGSLPQEVVAWVEVPVR